MSEEEVLEAIKNGDNAYSILCDKDRNYVTRFTRLTNALTKLLKDVEKDFPDARYYSDDGTLHLLLGADHADDSEGMSQSELVALSSESSVFNGGGW